MVILYYLHFTINLIKIKKKSIFLLVYFFSLSECELREYLRAVVTDKINWISISCKQESMFRKIN